MKMLPLHEDAQQARKGTDSHAGLWYDWFFNEYNADWQVADDGKTNWIKAVASAVGDATKLEKAAERQKAVVDAWEGNSLVMTTDWHFVTGLGNNHPVENGFAWHHTLGVPYLTGATVKGMLRAWCETWLGWKPTKKEKEGDPEKQDDPRLLQWFGDTEQSGELIFFDAIPTRPVQLKVDIMTPHYGKWYAEGGTRPNEPDTIPADWHDPVPVPFLVVDKGASFQFAVATRKNSKIDLDDVIIELQNALQWIGAGAKTAAGYGRMSEDPAIVAQKKREEEERQAEAEAKVQKLAADQAREEAECHIREMKEARRQQLDAMPEHERVLTTASDALQAIQPRLAGHSEVYGEMRSVINHLLDEAGGWEAQHRIMAVEWIEGVLDKHGWRHPDFSAAKRKKWETKMKDRLEKLRRG